MGEGGGEGERRVEEWRVGVGVGVERTLAVEDSCWDRDVPWVTYV